MDNKMQSLGNWMNDLLVNWGVPANWANAFDEIIVAGLLIALALLVNGLGRAVFVRGAERRAARSSRKWNRLWVKHKIPHYLMHIIPGLLIYYLLPLAFVRGKELLVISQRVCVVYIIFTILLTINGVMLMLLDIYNSREAQKNRPLKGFVQVLQVLLFFLGGILIVAVLIDKSPMKLFAGLGASAAVLMLVFKDSILGFVAGIQLSVNDMLRIGDWVTLPNGTADGIVQEITLNTVKIQNWDNTISTIPPYTLVSAPFRNWRGMQEGGGRQVDKKISLDLGTLCFCTPEMLEHYRQTIPLLADYRPAEGEVPTNSQLYRVYIDRYLSSHPQVNQDMDLIVSQKEPNAYGVPIRVYFFVRNKAWKEYERIQSDIFDHLLAMVPAFGLKTYQLSATAPEEKKG